MSGFSLLYSLRGTAEPLFLLRFAFFSLKLSCSLNYIPFLEFVGKMTANNSLRSKLLQKEISSTVILII